MIAYVGCCTRAMKVTTAEEAIELFLSSKRTRDDIGACMLQNGEDKFDMKIIVREWRDIKPEWEFRAFVFNNVMTSITQYWSACYVPKMKELKDEIAERVLKFWSETLKPLIKIEDYTIDFVIEPDTMEVWVIELNPSVRSITLEPVISKHSEFLTRFSRSHLRQGRVCSVGRIPMTAKLCRRDLSNSESLSSQYVKRFRLIVAAFGRLNLEPCAGRGSI
jgi:predicted choloylglycine hydrolase